ncbi:hypothetical protein [Alteromonas confluentis]|uniref:Uncharacterized protein n=1 Tax=Alteromonas confluentis TaxID=1656094 RepID=A0A1E7Z673_9ALTE|nr:hypothetical protein [Alteromonas confluentis]OFC69028.1 hypothetical protein BFC18_20020 [Alteromonas confluentis]
MFSIRGLSTGLVGLTLLLSGCASAPEPVNANIPLVSTKSIELVSAEVVSVPQGQIASGSQVQINGSLYLVGNSYLSASGMSCRTLKAMAMTAAPRSMCQRDGQWQVLSPLITHTNVQ